MAETTNTHDTANGVYGVLGVVFSFTHKTCPICGISKPIDEYHVYFSKQRQKHRIGNYCKLCARKNSNDRALIYYQTNKEEKKQYGRDFRANPKNKEKLKTQSQRFKVKYREELQPCYVRDRLVQEHGFNNSDLHEHPEIVEVFKNQIKLKRKLKSLQNGKE